MDDQGSGRVFSHRSPVIFDTPLFVFSDDPSGSPLLLDPPLEPSWPVLGQLPLPQVPRAPANACGLVVQGPCLRCDPRTANSGPTRDANSTSVQLLAQHAELPDEHCELNSL